MQNKVEINCVQIERFHLLGFPVFGHVRSHEANWGSLEWAFTRHRSNVYKFWAWTDERGDKYEIIIFLLLVFPHICQSVFYFQESSWNNVKIFFNLSRIRWQILFAAQ